MKYAPRQLTISLATKLLRQHGISIRRLPAWDEYRVNSVGQDEATAYYTNDLADAVGTGLAMAQVKVQVQ